MRFILLCLLLSLQLPAAYADSVPSEWQMEGAVQRTTPGAFGSWALMLSGASREPEVSARQRLSIPQPTPGLVTISGVVKGMAIDSVGDDREGVARVRVSFFDQKGIRMGAPKKLGSWFGNFGWKPWTATVRVPPNASEMELVIDLDGAVGTAFFDGLELLWGFPEDQDRSNLVVDGGFEYIGPLSLWDLGVGSELQCPGLNGRSALKVSLPDTASWEANQEWVVENGLASRKLHCSMNIKLERVMASHQSGGVRVEMELFTREGRSLGNKRLFGPWVGSGDWAKMSSTVGIPSGATKGTLRLILDQVKGTVFFDDVRVEAPTPSGLLERPLQSQSDTTTWRPFIPVDGPLTGPLDVSGLLDPPAGRHGFLGVRGGRFMFEDGTPIRFFGINIQGEYALPTHEKAGPLAQRLAQMGFNLVRLHHLDAGWARPNLFDPRFKDTQHLSTESLDRLDYFIAQLKSHGIYVYLDLLVSRQFTSEDGVAVSYRLNPGAKMIAEYDPRLIELQKQFARVLLSHYNPYTKSRLVNEPAIAVVDLINESSIFKLPERLDQIPFLYLEQLRELWLRHLTEQGISLTEKEKDGYLQIDHPLTQQFYANLQVRYFDTLSEYLRGLGLRVPIAGSNLSVEGWDLLTNARMDFIDRHAYWDYPKGGYGDLVKFHDRLLTESVKQSNPIVRLSRQHVKGLPFLVGEWNVAWPNEYRAVGPLLMAAYGLFRDWDGLLQFNTNGEIMPAQIDGNFDISTKPELFLQIPTVARLFHRHDVQAAHAEASSPWESNTGQLQWDVPRGRVMVQTPRTQAVVGRLGGVPITLQAVTFKVKTPFACLILTGLDDQELSLSRHLLLTTVARSENTGTVYNGTRTLLRKSGTTPIIMEPVVGSASLPMRERMNPKVFALDASGHRVEEVPVGVTGGSLRIPLGHAHLYEITFEEKA